MAIVKRARKRKRERQPWSDLPGDLLELIMARLFHADQVRFRAVCKTWRSIDRVQPVKQLPWLMVFNEHSWSSFKLIDPAYKKTYTVNIDIKDQEKNPYDIQVHASKCGWLLMSQLHDQHPSLFSYNPFTKERITLPDSASGFHIATFSSTPTSPDCVFFTLNSISPTIVSISTCRHGDDTWSTRNFECDFPVHGMKNTVYSEGVFYCSTGLGTVGTFSVDQQDWNVLAKPVYNLSYMYGTYMAKSGEEILLIVMREQGIWNPLSSRIFRLDRSKMNWKEVESLGDRALFLGSTSSVSVVAEREIANRIYYCSGSEAKYFTLNAARSYPCSKSYGSLARVHCKKIWIEPPQ